MNNIHKISYTSSSARPIKEIRNVLKLYNMCNQPCSILYPFVKFTTIMACHVDSQTKLRVILNNVKYLDFQNNKVVIVSSIDAPLHNTMVVSIKKFHPEIEIYSIPNTPQIDAGKWIYYLKNHYANNNNFVVMTNDSFLITDTIQHFYNAMAMRNMDLYGYNDSTQVTYHYQSYLFGLSNHAIKSFINYYNRNKLKLNGYMDVVLNIELKLVPLYEKSRDCFLKIGNIPSNIGQNIFFSNDTLYNILKNYKLLPFIKVKRMNLLKNNQKSVQQPPLIHNINMKINIQSQSVNNNIESNSQMHRTNLGVFNIIKNNFYSPLTFSKQTARIR